MQKPTIAEIKYATQGACPHYFDRKTLKHFGQTMRSFKVRRSPKGNIYIVAQMSRPGDYPGAPRVMGWYSFRRFIKSDVMGNSELAHVRDVDTSSYTDIDRYIESN